MYYYYMFIILIYIILQDYESDFQECTDSESSEVSEETNNYTNLSLDPIELHTTKQVLTFILL